MRGHAGLFVPVALVGALSMNDVLCLNPLALAGDAVEQSTQSVSMTGVPLCFLGFGAFQMVAP